MSVVIWTFFSIVLFTISRILIYVLLALTMPPTQQHTPAPARPSEVPEKRYRPLVKDFDADCGFDLSKVKIEKGGRDHDEAPPALFIPPSFQQRRAHLQQPGIMISRKKYINFKKS